MLNRIQLISISEYFYYIAALMSFFTIVYFLIKGKKNLRLLSFIGFQGMILLWSTRDSLRVIANSGFFWVIGSFKIKIVQVIFQVIYIRLEFVAECFLGLSWLIFVLLYTGNKIIKKKRIMLLLLIPSIFFYFTFLTNGYHRLFFKDNNFYNPGLFYSLLILTTYIYFIAGIFILIRYFLKQFGYAKKQSALLILSGLFPLTVYFIQNQAPNFYTFSRWSDITPIGFSISILLTIIAAFRYRFLDIAPLALRKLVDSISQSIIVVDAYNQIIDLNDSFIKIFRCKELRKYDQISEFLKLLGPQLYNTPDNYKLLQALGDPKTIYFIGEIKLNSINSEHWNGLTELGPNNPCLIPVYKFYEVTIQPIFRKKKDILGRIISFNDITEYKKLMAKTNDKNTQLAAMNQELEAANKQLQEYSSAIEELTIIKERNRFARDVHDTLGHSMTVLLTLLKVSEITCATDPEKTREKIAEAIEVAKSGLNELRRSISGLVPERLEGSTLVNALRNLIADYESSGMHVDFTLDGIEEHLAPLYSGVIYRVCEESLTNSLRHGKAKHVTLILRFVDERIKIFITDDGCGCPEPKKGFGLSGMEQRIKDLNGNFEFGSDGEHGFNIYVDIPIKR